MAGADRGEIQDEVAKQDGAPATPNLISRVIAKKTACPDWEGAEAPKTGRSQALTEDQTQQVVDLVFAERGKARVTVPYCKKKLKFLRQVHDTTVSRALHAAGLKYLTRRRKAWMPDAHKVERLAFARGVLRRRDSTLKRWAYTDGTSYYLARCPDEDDQKRRAALGRYVWREAGGKDGLFNDNIGASLYAKATASDPASRRLDRRSPGARRPAGRGAGAGPMGGAMGGRSDRRPRGPHGRAPRPRDFP